MTEVEIIKTELVLLQSRVHDLEHPQQCVDLNIITIQTSIASLEARVNEILKTPNMYTFDLDGIGNGCYTEEENKNTEYMMCTQVKNGVDVCVYSKTRVTASVEVVTVENGSISMITRYYTFREDISKVSKQEIETAIRGEFEMKRLAIV